MQRRLGLQIANILVTINSTATIFIYIAFSSKYRAVLRMLFGFTYDR
jgi:hypothetical protein